MYSEDDYLMLSALQHLLFCERQCFLIHAEQQWAENRYTASGDIMHRKVDRKSIEMLGDDLMVERGLMLGSARLGLSGKADIVEFHRQPNGGWLPFPVEYKNGRPKKNNSDLVQLCAQALCLEEMLNITIPAGALFYGRNRRRMTVEFSLELRNETLAAVTRLHRLIPFGKPPPPEYSSKKCSACSLINLCLPEVTGKPGRARKYLDSILEDL